MASWNAVSDTEVCEMVAAEVTISEHSYSVRGPLSNPKPSASTEAEVDVDPLIWWKANAGSFKCLSILAKKYLCVAATSVASERVFSTSGNIVSAKRNRLSPETVDMLTFLAKNLD